MQFQTAVCEWRAPHQEARSGDLQESVARVDSFPHSLESVISGRQVTQHFGDDHLLRKGFLAEFLNLTIYQFKITDKSSHISIVTEPHIVVVLLQLVQRLHSSALMDQSKFIPDFLGGFAINNLMKDWLIHQLYENRESLLVTFLEIKNRVLNGIPLFGRQDFLGSGSALKESASKLDLRHRSRRRERRQNRQGFCAVNDAHKPSTIKKCLCLKLPNVVLFAIVLLEITELLEVIHGGRYAQEACYVAVMPF